MAGDADAIELLAVDVSPELAALIAAHPLPDGVDDADMNMDEIAAALGASVNTISKWAKQGMPVSQEGGAGRAYVLRLSHCWAWRQDDLAKNAAKTQHNKDVIVAMQASFLGVDLDDDGVTLTAKERRELSEADLKEGEARRARRQLVRIEEVTDLFEAVLGTIRAGAEALPDLLERELSLKSEEVEIVRKSVFNFLDKAAKKVEDAELREREIGEVEYNPSLLI